MTPHIVFARCLWGGIVIACYLSCRYKRLYLMTKSWKKRWEDILSKITLIHQQTDEVLVLDGLVATNTPKTLAFVNAHAMNLLTEDQFLYESLLNSDYLLRDGSGMRIFYKLLGRTPGLNMNGTDFIPKVLSKFHGKTAVIWGTQEPYLSQAAVVIAERFAIEVISTHHGFESIGYYEALTKKMRPDLILLGMGMPKQEVLARTLKKSNTPALIICGGAVVDFLGGKVTRAPFIYRRFGFEWLYRFLCEPRRLFKRYVAGNPLFLIRALLFKLR